LARLYKTALTLCHSYLSADYERGVFNVSACKWVQGAKENVVTITSKDSAASGGSGSSSTGLSSGAIGGIVVGCIAFAAMIGAIVAFFLLRRRKAASYKATGLEPRQSGLNGLVFNAEYPSPFGTEPTLPSQERSEASPSTGAAIGSEHSNELDGRDTQVKPTTELDGTEIQGLHSQSAQIKQVTTPIYELGAGEIGGATAR